MEEIAVNFQRRVRELSTTLPSSLQGPLGRWGQELKGRGELDRAARHIPSEGEIPSVRSRVTGEIGLKRRSVQSYAELALFPPR